MMQAYRAYAPASAANLSVGFDLLGAALKPVSGQLLGDEIIISRAAAGSGCVIECRGRYADRLPDDPKKNIVYAAYELFGELMGKKGLAVPDVSMELNKNLPVCSGLGSSASSVVAAVVALDAVCGNPLFEEEKLELMGRLEGKISGSIHYDNVAPCYFGGLQLIVGEENTVSRTLPDFDRWLWVSCFPGIKVSTSAARQILPKAYDRATCITYARHLANFVDACHRGDEQLAASCLVDVIAEPYRKSLIPGFDEARAFGEKTGAIATGISGSGSSIFTVVDDMDKASEMKEFLERNFIANEDGFCQICRIDRHGAYAEKIEG